MLGFKIWLLLILIEFNNTNGVYLFFKISRFKQKFAELMIYFVLFFLTELVPIIGHFILKTDLQKLV
jgi:hypothetical protein